MQLNQLFSEERTPVVGTICDRLRTKGNDVYEFGDTGATYTIRAKSDKIAIATICALYGSFTHFVHIHYPKSAIPMPNMVVPEEGFNYYGTDEMAGCFLMHHIDAFFDALSSVLPGTRLHRETLMESMPIIGTTPEKWENFKNLWIQKQRDKMKIDIEDCLCAKGLRLIEMCKKTMQTVNPDFKSQPEWKELQEKVANVEYK